ncbi:hypothetical protein [Cytobacillus sp. IB215316]|uniref:hypothetical protein n=1 Tax=Cytobacillus sp. IB215316 TaxID=3097354 RepID=UPI002A1480C1|nr:hypothetical protein [Cytobacillus sp. IB215316]MDX8363460.1 hypothetical protein [Cytobacillus sp. IB215316]
MNTYLFVITMVCWMCMMVIWLDQGISTGNTEFISIEGSPNTPIIDQNQLLL